MDEVLKFEPLESGAVHMRRGITIQRSSQDEHISQLHLVISTSYEGRLNDFLQCSPQADLGDVAV